MGNKDNEIPVVLTVDSSQLQDLDRLASDVPSEITIDVTANADFDALPFDEIPDEIAPEIDLTETENSKSIRDSLSFIAFKEKVTWIIDIAGNVLEFAGKLNEAFVSPFLDVEDAVARITAQTGVVIPDLDQMIRDIQAADLGDSVGQIADVLIAAQQLQQPMEEAATAALTFTHTWTEEDPTTVLQTLVALVETGLVPNLQTASDLMTVFFQQGGDKGKDALNVVQANAQSWADMELTGTEALSTINSLMDSGVDTATDAAKMIQTLDDALTTAAENADSPQAEMLRNLGMKNPKEDGQAMGAEFIDGFATAFATQPTDQQDLISGLLFGKGGKKFTGAIAGMDTQGGMFADVVGAAEDAAKAIDDSLRGAIDDFVLEINTSVTRLLASDAIDLDGKIAVLKEKFQEAAEVLASGGTIGEALEVTFGIEGVDAALLNIQRIFGQLVLTLLEIVATIQDPLGVTDADKATRAELARLATQQLPFDIKVANPEELEAIFGQAAKRGVTIENLGAGLTTALDELVAEGDFSKVIDIVDMLSQAEGVTPEAVQIFRDKYITPLGTAFDDAIASGDFDLAKKIADAQGDPTAYTDALKGKFGFDAADFDQMAADFAAGMETSIAKESWWDDLKPPVEFSTDLDTAKTDVTNFGTDTKTAMEQAALVTGLASDDMVAALAAMSDGVISTDEEIALHLTGNTVTASFEAVALSAEENIPIVINWFGQATEAVQEFDRAADRLPQIAGMIASLDAAVGSFDLAKLQAIQAAANGGGVPGGGGGDTTNNVNVNQTNNVSNGAQATATTYDIAAAVRPGG